MRDRGAGEPLVIMVRDHDGKNVAEALSEFLDRNKDIDGLIGSTQGKTAIALQVLKKKGVRIPGDIAVVGFDDTPGPPCWIRPDRRNGEHLFHGQAGRAVTAGPYRRQKKGPAGTSFLRTK
jgi:hypothetical protein